MVASEAVRSSLPEELASVVATSVPVTNLRLQVPVVEGVTLMVATLPELAPPLAVEAPRVKVMWPLETEVLTKTTESRLVRVITGVPQMES